ncbi:uncharacterized protein H6S33_003648 [Morchella sextelata]|uniref:uncharacterized protein n=1 Tax=Morchella sextelata TaxID=1174677 RepID=UPI001D048A34|nr:uncharacterized protein H6S33_003648 [Morchella sextelata]KAH0606814.1 hypothetical protein H6S33_003648 [Morchella sextelata]
MGRLYWQGGTTHTASVGIRSSRGRCCPHIERTKIRTIIISTPSKQSSKEMLAQRLSLSRALAHRPILPRPIPTTYIGVRSFRAGFPRLPEEPDNSPVYTEANDPEMNGGYVNPIPQKRQFRDPYGDWWDKQGRRNYGEPLHEDDDILGRFTPEEYTWTTPQKGMVMIGTFVLAVFGLCGAVYSVYPDKPAVPRRFPHGGLVDALGGPGALPALSDSDE